MNHALCCAALAVLLAQPAMPQGPAIPAEAEGATWLWRVLAESVIGELVRDGFDKLLDALDRDVESLLTPEDRSLVANGLLDVANKKDAYANAVNQYNLGRDGNNKEALLKLVKTTEMDYKAAWLVLQNALEKVDARVRKEKWFVSSKKLSEKLPPLALVTI